MQNSINDLRRRLQMGFNNPAFDAFLDRKDSQIYQVLATLRQQSSLTIPEFNQEIIRAWDTKGNRRLVVPQLAADGQSVNYIPKFQDCGIQDWSRMVLNNGCYRLSNSLKETIQAIVENHKNLIYYRSHLGDAVKNTDNMRYDYLTAEFKALSYDQKILALKEYGLRNIDGIGYRQWPLQQWGKNIIRYANLTNKHILYVQTDLAYCSYPSMFAEAMCSSGFFDGHKYYAGSGWHFFGPLMDLLCVGEWGIEEEIRNLIPSQVPIFKAGPDQWWNMTDTFLIDVYNYRHNSNEWWTIPEWMLYPISVWKNKHLPIKAFNGTLKMLTGSRIPFQNARTVADLHHYTRELPISRYIIRIKDDRYVLSDQIKNVAISHIIGPFDGDLEILVPLNFSTNPTDAYDLKENIVFSGTLQAPVIIIDGVAFNAIYP